MVLWFGELLVEEGYLVGLLLVLVVFYECVGCVCMFGGEEGLVIVIGVVLL